MNSRMCCDITNNYANFYPHEFDSYVVLVPSSSVKPHRMFHPTTGLFFLFAFLLFSFIWILFKCVLYQKKKVTDYEDIFVEVLGMLLITKAVKDSSYISERILITSILLFATVLSIIEASIIYEEMVKDLESIEINTLKELKNTNYPILLTADTKILMEYGKVNDNLQKKFVLMENFEITYEILSGNTSQAYVLRRSRAEFLQQRYSMQKDGRSIFHIVKESLCESLVD